jgi:hypothetical protein
MVSGCSSFRVHCPTCASSRHKQAYVCGWLQQTLDWMVASDLQWTEMGLRFGAIGSVHAAIGRSRLVQHDSAL